MSETHPIRLVIADDLRRSRLTVLFRLALAIPHLLWVTLWSIAAFVVCVSSWLVTLATGRSPRGLHDFLAAFLRYTTHVGAYLLLAANPFPGFLGKAGTYPIDLEIAPPERQRRWVTLLRLFLAVPALVISSALMGGGGNNVNQGVAPTAAFLGWWAALVRGRMPRGLRNVIAWSLGYTAQTAGYLFLLTDRYPYSGPEAYLAGEPAERDERRPRLVVTDELRRSRLTVFFRLPLAIPHLVWLFLWSVAALLAAIVNWLATLALGRSPRPLARFLAAYVRYSVHLGAFISLVGGPFPGFVGRAGSYPVDLALDPFARQSRWITLFRLPLVVPAALMSSALDGLVLAVAILGWFSSLVRGAMPQGLRNAGAYGIGYGGQVTAYALLLTDRYPYSGPEGV